MNKYFLTFLKCISEQSRLSVRVFLKILAHLAYLVRSFSLIFDRMNKLKKARKQESKAVSKAGCLVELFQYFSSSSSFGLVLFFCDFQCNQYIQLLLI